MQLLQNETTPDIAAPNRTPTCPECGRLPSEAQEFSVNEYGTIHSERCSHECHKDHDRTAAAWQNLIEANAGLNKELQALRGYTQYITQGVRPAYGEGFMAGFTAAESGSTVDTAWAESVAQREIEKINKAVEESQIPASPVE